MMFGPNISGEFGYMRNDDGRYKYATGAFSTAGAGHGYTGTYVTHGFKWIFNAGESNSIYGRSSIVQPSALATLVLIKT